MAAKKKTSPQAHDQTTVARKRRGPKPLAVTATAPTPAEPLPTEVAGAPVTPPESLSPAVTSTQAEAALSPPEQSPKVTQLSARDAATKVLGETGLAMSCQELIVAMAAKGYWSSPNGKTPASTLYAAILQELKTKGVQARFRKTEPGRFMLRTRA
jgi:hypothetical protein